VKKKNPRKLKQNLPCHWLLLLAKDSPFPQTFPKQGNTIKWAISTKKLNREAEKTGLSIETRKVGLIGALFFNDAQSEIKYAKIPWKWKRSLVFILQWKFSTFGRG